MPRIAPRRYDRDDAHEPGRLTASALAMFARRPADTVAGVLAGACTLMILVNAVALQQGRVAPPASEKLSAAAAPSGAPQKTAGANADLVAQVQTALAERDLYDGVVDGVSGAGTIAAIRAFEQSQGMASTGEASEKVLAALLIAPMRRAEAPKPAPQAPPGLTTGSTAAPNPRLMAAQRALAKLGYGPVTIDGKMGAGTRTALRSFERDRGLPETGEPSQRTLKALQAMTGAPLQ